MHDKRNYLQTLFHWERNLKCGIFRSLRQHNLEFNITRKVILTSTIAYKSREEISAKNNNANQQIHTHFDD